MRTLFLALLVAVLAPALRAEVCDNAISATFTISSGTGSREIIPAVSRKSIMVCAFIFNADTAGAVKLVNGTGTNCGASTEDLLLIGNNLTGATWGLNDPHLASTTSSAVCINFSATVSATGTIFYVVR